jgi:hypothetical protein
MTRSQTGSIFFAPSRVETLGKSYSEVAAVNVEAIDDAHLDIRLLDLDLRH